MINLYKTDSTVAIPQYQSTHPVEYDWWRFLSVTGSRKNHNSEYIYIYIYDSFQKTIFIDHEEN